MLVLPRGGIDVSKTIPSGFYLDASGELKKDRRQNQDRRDASVSWDGTERRDADRRQSDYAATAREHDRMIEDALGEFAAQHEH